MPTQTDQSPEERFLEAIFGGNPKDFDPFDVSAHLHNAIIRDVGKKKALEGNIYNDRLKRWPNGTRITTGAIGERLSDKLFKCADGNYLVKNWLS
jgi:hypothetical protein